MMSWSRVPNVLPNTGPRLTEQGTHTGAPGTARPHGTCTRMEGHSFDPPGTSHGRLKPIATRGQPVASPPFSPHPGGFPSARLTHEGGQVVRT